MDAEKERKKLGDKKQKMIQQLTKLKDTASRPDYEEKVPEDIRTANAEKVEPRVSLSNAVARRGGGGEVCSVCPTGSPRGAKFI